MNTNSNKYIFIYASVMVIIVAAILSTAAMLLKPYQEENKRVEKMENILKAALEGPDAPVINAENAAELYAKYIQEEIVVDLKGNVLNTYTVADGRMDAQSADTIRAFQVDLKSELDHIKKGEKAVLPVFKMNNNGQILYVIPVRGLGLWGPIWGNIALESNFNTVAGATFGHKGETPGLGAEIDTRAFQEQFIGKDIFNSNGELVSIKVVKGGVANVPQADRIHAVDAISGGTITSVGVQDMLFDCLNYYKPFFESPKN